MTANLTPDPFDPSRIGDPIARAVSWSPRGSSSTNARTCQLQEESDDRLVLRASRATKLLCGALVAIGAVCIAGFLAGALRAGEGTDRTELITAGVFGLLFLGGGWLVYRLFGSPRVFDRRRNQYWRGGGSPDDPTAWLGVKDVTDLREIHALQILSKRVRSKNSSYTCYELNLVLKDASRVNVLVTGRGQSLREEADRLGDFLRVPVWEITAGEPPG